MFKIFTVIRPALAPVQPKATNHFHQYAVEMPAELMEALKKRIYTVLMHKFYGIDIPHDLSTNHLIVLDDFMGSRLTSEVHNLVIDAFEMALLKRFLHAERVIVSQRRRPLAPGLSNTEYWNLTGDLLRSIVKPTELTTLSLFP